jgi:RNA 2',3'-cyclic 3'-phosphodiesterase
MPRLFVAVELPPAVRADLAALRADIPGARWVKPEQMHLTLRFIGADVPDDRVEPIREALATVTGAAFSLTLRGVGRFPPGDRKPPRVLWAGMDKAPALFALQHSVESALAAVGFPPEDRPFSAHITLARVNARQPIPQADRFLRAHADFAAGPFPVDQFVLFQSALSPQGPRYQQLGIYPLS